MDKALNQMATVQPTLAPVHLAGAGAIAEAFKVRREVVMEWIKKGMPVAQDPRTGRFDGEYNKIQAWREKYYPAKSS